MTDRKTVLVVSAHAADFVWRAGGAIALHQQLGYEVTIVCLSYGERGESAKLWKEPGATLEKVKASRRNEAKAAAQALGAHDIQFFDLGDYPLEMDRQAKFQLADLMRAVQPRFLMSHSLYDPYNTDHAYATQVTMECRMIAQAWGHNPGEQVLGAPQLYLFEPHQTEQMQWKPDVFLDITQFGIVSGPPLSAWRGSSICGITIQTWRRTVAIISVEIQVVRLGGARPVMPRDFSRFTRVQWMSCDAYRYPTY